MEGTSHSTGAQNSSKLKGTGYKPKPSTQVSQFQDNNGMIMAHHRLNSKAVKS